MLLLVLSALASPADSFSDASLPFDESDRWRATGASARPDSTGTRPAASPTATDPPFLSTAAGVIACIVLPAIVAAALAAVATVLARRKGHCARRGDSSDWANPARYIIKENLEDA
jgi:hypothetical protein